MATRLDAGGDRSRVRVRTRVPSHSADDAWQQDRRRQAPGSGSRSGTDQLADTRLFIDVVEKTTWTSQGSALLSRSIATRAGLLPTGQNWYVDDARGRKLTTPEPLTTVRPLDWN